LPQIAKTNKRTNSSTGFSQVNGFLFTAVNNKKWLFTIPQNHPQPNVEEKTPESGIKTRKNLISTKFTCSITTTKI
jgi:hypothetical protein